ncbi:programmed cell death protein 2 [Fukomys damarensis]|uniref:Programmed cell death protein 2 n=1 Tax=Fukomys damarensis TaxID=885580 RepID=A0A091DGM7_FUKDA|nr:programmed cell death protein 2 [Fukomys damarensis]KFO31274.1 Programmed cell death protein 2 [Fukomys damarensis]
MAAAGPASVELGFAEEAPAWRLRSEQFPSKRLRWLNCCSGSLKMFILSSFLVFRNQLPRKNEFYSFEPPSENPPPEAGEPVRLQLKSGTHLCRVCGCLAPKTCSRCHQAHYCSKEHQTLDWRLVHKQTCTQDQVDHAIPDHNFLFPEFEIVIETEDETVSEVVEKEDDSEIIESMGEAPEEELDSMAKHETREDSIFQKFKTQIAHEPEQILRYGRGIEPIWISGENIPQEKDIPDCPCGAKRIFEFQVMPQLLNHLKADRLGRSVDWGVLAIFTCAESCSLGSGYTQEFVWKQDVTDNTLKL